MVRRSVVFDDEDEFEAENLGGGGNEDDDEDVGLDEYEKDDFIVDDVDEEDEDDFREDGNNDDDRRKKKRKKKDFELDEEDLLLLQEANVPVSRNADKKFKRLKKAEGDDGEYEDEEDEDDEDDMADFIVDDEVDEAGASRSGQKAKKKYGQASGSSSSAIQQAHEIFGEAEDLLNQRREKRDKGRRYDETGEKRLEDEFEPSVLMKKYMTETDEEIRDFDVPERLQTYETITGPPSMDIGAFKAEATWIRKQLESAVAPVCVNMPMLGEQEIEVFEDHITNFLSFIHVQKLDLPFVAMYRKEDISSLLKDPETFDCDKPSLKWHKVLWAVQELDTKWLVLQKRKSALLAYYNKRYEEESGRIDDETRHSLNRKRFLSILEVLDQAESEREVDDVDTNFNLHFPPGETGLDEGKSKRPKRTSHYGVCYKTGLWEAASKFGCSSEQFGLQISLLATRVDEPEDHLETPEEVASKFIGTMFDSPQNVLKGARHMAAVEISCEPRVKKHYRSIYFDNAVVSTCPTTEGNTVIDAFHQFAAVKWLRNKPLNKFEDTQWLLIQKAEEEKLLQVTVKLPEEIINKLRNDSQEKYLSGGVSKSAQLWNEQRKLILEDAIFNIILPALEKEARLLLTSRSKNRLLMEYGKRLWDKVSLAPYKRKESEIRSEDEVPPRVMASCWSPGRPPTTFVMLDSFGEIVDVLEAGSISLKSQNVTDQQRKIHDQQRLLRFMTEHQPEVVILGAVSFSCTRLKDDIYEIVLKMAEENPRDEGHVMDGLTVLYGDESLPRLYENSHISSEQIPGQRGIVKRAVALGRYLQNPLAMVAALCGHHKDVLSWKICPLESFLNADEKYGMVEQIMVNVTNQVGLDLNLAANHEWLFTPLQFISGLGPRKAASLQRSLLRAGAIVTRKDLLTSHGLGRKVFISVAGFLRIRRSGLVVSTNQVVDVLDDTRIHPESYALAQEMTRDIYKAIVGDDILEDDDDAFEMAIENLRDRPSDLKSFSLDEYAKATDRMSKMETLLAMKLELIQGFQDWRKPYEEPNQDEQFYLISGETDDTLVEGRTVKATVRRVQPQRAICAMESGLTGMLTREDYSDDSEEIDLTEKLHVGNVLTCKVKSILKDRYQVFLTCKEQDMRNNINQNIENQDPYYHEDRSSLQSGLEKARKEKELAKKHFKPRMIVHSRFQNLTADEAMEFLANKVPGESIIRPSSRGPSFLTITLKIHDGVYAHKDIVEGKKELKDITSLLRIGKSLKIGEDTFEDLDEVVARYIDPLIEHLKAFLNYRKFRAGTKAEIDESLRSEKLDNPTKIAYCFGISHEHPGTFILTYIRSSNPHHEYIGLYPKGFKFRKMLFEDVDRLVAYFQKHINDPLQPVAATFPASGGGWSGSGGNDGGWQGSSDGDGGRTGGRGRGRGRGCGRGDGEGGRGRGRGRGRDSYDGGNRDGGGYQQDSGQGGSTWSSDNKGNSSWGAGGGSSSGGLGGSGGGGSSWGDKNKGDGGGGGGSWGEKNNEGTSSGGGWGDKNKDGGGGGSSSWVDKNNKDAGTSDAGGSWGDKNKGGSGGGGGWGSSANGSGGGNWGDKSKRDGGEGGDGSGGWGGSGSGRGGGGNSWGDKNKEIADGSGGGWGGGGRGSGGGSWADKNKKDGNDDGGADWGGRGRGRGGRGRDGGSGGGTWGNRNEGADGGGSWGGSGGGGGKSWGDKKSEGVGGGGGWGGGGNWADKNKNDGSDGSGGDSGGRGRGRGRDGGSGGSGCGGGGWGDKKSEGGGGSWGNGGGGGSWADKNKSDGSDSVGGDWGGQGRGRGGRGGRDRDGGNGGGSWGNKNEGGAGGGGSWGGSGGGGSWGGSGGGGSWGGSGGGGSWGDKNSEGGSWADKNRSDGSGGGGGDWGGRGRGRGGCGGRGRDGGSGGGSWGNKTEGGAGGGSWGGSGGESGGGGSGGGSWADKNSSRGGGRGRGGRGGGSWSGNDSGGDGGSGGAGSWGGGGGSVGSWADKNSSGGGGRGGGGWGNNSGGDAGGGSWGGGGGGSRGSDKDSGTAGGWRDKSSGGAGGGSSGGDKDSGTAGGWRDKSSGGAGGASGGWGDKSSGGAGGSGGGRGSWGGSSGGGGFGDKNKEAGNASDKGGGGWGNNSVGEAGGGSGSGSGSWGGGGGGGGGSSGGGKDSGTAGGWRDKSSGGVGGASGGWGDKSSGGTGGSGGGPGSWGGSSGGGGFGDKNKEAGNASGKGGGGWGNNSVGEAGGGGGSGSGSWGGSGSGGGSRGDNNSGTAGGWGDKSSGGAAGRGRWLGISGFDDENKAAGNASGSGSLGGSEDAAGSDASKSGWGSTAKTNKGWSDGGGSGGGGGGGGGGW